jgi:hypothetical protein
MAKCMPSRRMTVEHAQVQRLREDGGAGAGPPQSIDFVELDTQDESKVPSTLLPASGTSKEPQFGRSTCMQFVSMPFCS